MTAEDAASFWELQRKNLLELKQIRSRQQFVSQRLGELLAERREENRKSGFLEDDRAALRAVLAANPDLAADYLRPWR